MKPKAKKVTTGLLALTAVAIWIPQIMVGVVQKSPAPRPEFEDDEAWGDESDWTDGEQWDGARGDAAYSDLDGDVGADAVAYAEDGEFGPSEGALPLGGTLVERLAEMTGHLRLFGDTQRVDLDALLEEAQPVTRTPVVSTAPVGAPTGAELSLRLAGDALVAFAGEQTLTAIIHRGDDPIAMLGERMVRVGDTVAEGVEVAEITPRRLRLAGAGGSVWLSLAPFRPRSRDEGEGTDEGDAFDEAPASEPAPVVLETTPAPEAQQPAGATETEEQP